MWKTKDSNKIVGLQMKVDAYKLHRKNINKIKSRFKPVKNEPWKPSFSLSKNKNKYFKVQKTEVNKQNDNLVRKIIQIETKPMQQTFLVIPKFIPSNKENFEQYKKRQRQAKKNEIMKENASIMRRLTSTNTNYSRDKLDKEWKQHIKYRQNILKKDYVPDLFVLAKASQTKSKNASRIRPKTALEERIEI